jgi:ABC-type phosphate transport system permease subunit
MASTLAGEFPEAATNDLHRGALMELALILLLMSSRVQRRRPVSRRRQ